MQLISTRSAQAIGFSLLMGLAYFCLYPATSGGFLFDDFPNLKNLDLIEGSLSFNNIGDYLASWQGNPGRPLAALSFLIEGHDWPSDPTSFKRNNILWHLLAGVLVFGFARKLTRLVGELSIRADWMALAATALWLVHPIHLSTTMLVVQRMTILSQGLIVAGLWLYLVILDQPSKKAPTGAILAVAVLGLFGGLSFLAKENGPLIFVYATVLNLTVAAPLIARFPHAARRLLWFGTAGMTLALIAGLLWHVRDPVAAYASRDFTLWERLLTQPRVLLDYLGIIFVPGITGSIYHDDFVVSRSLISPISTAPALGALLGALFAAVSLRLKKPLLGFAILWFLAGHLIESTVIQLEIHFEHRNYLAMFGPILALVVAVGRSSWIAARIKALAAISLFGLLAGLTFFAASTWGDPLRLAQAWANEKPDSVRSQQLLASELTKLRAYNEADQVLSNAFERLPEASEFRFQQAMLACIAGTARRDTFEALEEFAHDANWARVIPDVIQSLRQQLEGDACDGSLSFETFQRIILALLANEDFVARKATEAHLHNEIAMAALELGRLELALEHFERSHKLRPVVQQALNRVAIALQLKQFDAAREAITDAYNSRQPLKSWLRQDDRRIARWHTVFNGAVDQEIQARYRSAPASPDNTR